MIKDNEFDKDIQDDRHDDKIIKSKTQIDSAKEKLKDLQTIFTIKKEDSKQKIQEAKSIMQEAKSLDKMRRARENELDNAIQQELSNALVANKQLKKATKVYDKATNKRQNAEEKAIQEGIKTKDLERSTEILRVKEDVANQEKQLAGKLYDAALNMENAKREEVKIKIEMEAKQFIEAAHNEVDKLNYRYEDYLKLKKLRAENILSEADIEYLDYIERERLALVAKIESDFEEECNNIYAVPEEELSAPEKKKLIKQAKAKHDQAVIVANKMAEVMLEDVALEKLARGRELLEADIVREKKLILEGISKVSEDKRIKIIQERDETLAMIEKEKDEGIASIISDPELSHEQKETLVRQFLKEKSLEAKAALRKAQYEERARILAEKAEIKIAFKQLAGVQKEINELHLQTIMEGDTELHSLDHLITEAAEKARLLNDDILTLQKEKDARRKDILLQAESLSQETSSTMNTVCEEVKDVSENNLKPLDAKLTTLEEEYIKNQEDKSNDISLVQQELDLAKQFAIEDKKLQIAKLKDEAEERAKLKDKIHQVKENRLETLTKEEQDALTEKTQEILQTSQFNDLSNEDLMHASNEAIDKIIAEEFNFDTNLLSLEDLAELEALETELAKLEGEKQAELEALEAELLSLELNKEEEYEKLKSQGEAIKQFRRNDLGNLEAEILALEDEKQKVLEELNKN